MYPKKWRKTIDPYSLDLKEFQIKEVLGYPHAGNDVFYARGEYRQEEKLAFIKVERQKTANIKREIDVLENIDLDIKPKILEYGLDKPAYLIIEEARGQRLSTLLEENKNFKSLDYMPKYGELLAKIHRIDTYKKPVLDRPLLKNKGYYLENNLLYIWEYLDQTQINPSYCFIHGDCHYANILWQEGKVTSLLDYELSGYGIREFDLAWALVLRPGQKFLKTEIERNLFLEEYSKYEEYNEEALDYYLVLVAMFFFSIDIEKDYRSLLINMIDKIVKKWVY